MATFKPEEVESIRESFNQFDADHNGHITVTEIGEVFKTLGENMPGYKIRDMVKEVDIDENGTVEFDEFLEMYKKVKSGKVSFKLADTANEAKKLVTVTGLSEASAEGTTHSFSEEEKIAFVDWINYQLEEDPDVKKALPVSEDGDGLFTAVHDGIILCKLINTSVSNTVDERAINKGKLNVFTMQENQTLALNSASSIGCNIINIGPQDIMEGRPHLILGLLWQVIKIGLFAKISLSNCPNLAVLLEDGETLDDLLALSPEEILLRWFNYHLQQAGSNRRVKNFSGDIKDSEAYTILLNQIAPEDAGVDMSPMQESDPEQRAEKMLKEAHKIGCRKFVRPKDVVKGNARLNLAYVANLFNSFPALKAPDDGLPDFDLGDYNETREEKTFRNWMNSMGVDPFVNNLYQDLKDGHVLLQLFDKISPGIVKWDKVNKKPYKKMGGNMKKLENDNYAIEVAQQLKFSLVGVAGKDIFDGNKTLTLAVVWQAMRAYTLSVLQKLAKSDKPISDGEIVEWVNTSLAGAGKSSSITGFKDPRITTSLPVLDLVDSIKPESVNYDLVSPNADDDETKLQNAKYAISMSRKIGARVYALPEDIVEPNSKMCLTIFACLMTRAKQPKK